MTTKPYVRVIVPDSHGSEIDEAAANAFLADLGRIDPDEIVMLGDHVDVSYPFNTHEPNYLQENDYDYEGDIGAANRFLDSIQAVAPRATIHYLEGNHEAHVERFAARFIGGKLGAKFLRDNGPEGMLHLADRGISYYRSKEFYHGLTCRGAIRLGLACFTHGFSTSKFCTERHLARFNYNVFHGHSHRAQTFRTRTVRDEALIGGSYGCLSLQQPLWRHTDPTDWTHGYGIHFVASTGRFQDVAVAIVGGESMMGPLIKAIR